MQSFIKVYSVFSFSFTMNHIRGLWLTAQFLKSFSERGSQL